MRKIVILSLVFVAMLCAPMIAQDDARVSELESEINLLKAELEMKDSQIKKLKGRVAELETQLADKQTELNETLVALEDALNPKTETEDIKKEWTLEDAGEVEADELTDLIGDRVYGKTVVHSVLPDSDGHDYKVTLTDTSEQNGRRYRRFINDRWVAVRCAILVDEVEASKIKEGDFVTISGIIRRVKVTPETDDTIEVITFYLKEATRD